MIPKLGGEGGAIVLDAEGNFGMPFNTEGMYRGWIGADGVPHVASIRTRRCHLCAYRRG